MSEKTGKNKPEKHESFAPPLEVAVKPPNPTPETSEQMINSYGTYNIQPTANTPNIFPTIAQGLPQNLAEGLDGDVRKVPK